MIHLENETHEIRTQTWDFKFWVWWFDKTFKSHFWVWISSVLRWIMKVKHRLYEHTIFEDVGENVGLLSGTACWEGCWNTMEVFWDLCVVFSAGLFWNERLMLMICFVPLLLLFCLVSLSCCLYTCFLCLKYELSMYYGFKYRLLFRVLGFGDSSTDFCSVYWNLGIQVPTFVLCTWDSFYSHLLQLLTLCLQFRLSKILKSVSNYLCKIETIFFPPTAI